MSNMDMDLLRYNDEKMPAFQFFFRKYQESGILRLFYKCLFVISRKKRHIDMAVNSQIGGGVYFSHAYNITINPKVIVGCNCNINKGVTIGQENRGKRKGTPIIGDNVWLGVNSTIVGNIKIGNDVLIAPGAFVNFDVPEHSVVIGNPGIIKRKDNATLDYINNTIA